MKQISPFLFEVWSTFHTLMGISNFVVGSVFSNKLPVNARDVCTTVNQGASVNDFQHVGRSNEL